MVIENTIRMLNWKQVAGGVATMVETNYAENVGIGANGGLHRRINHSNSPVGENISSGALSVTTGKSARITSSRRADGVLVGQFFSGS
jgi:hypothetical protein